MTHTHICTKYAHATVKFWIHEVVPNQSDNNSIEQLQVAYLLTYEGNFNGEAEIWFLWTWQIDATVNVAQSVWCLPQLGKWHVNICVTSPYINQQATLTYDNNDMYSQW